MIHQFAPGGFDRNFSYLAWDRTSRIGLVVDPCGDVKAILDEIRKRRIWLHYIINTHGHEDHTAGNEMLCKHTDAVVLIHPTESDAVKNIARIKEVVDGSKFRVGRQELVVHHTPGHSRGSICVHYEEGLFTGDTLFVDWCGRAEDRKILYDTLQKIMRRFPDYYTIYPGHDYGQSRTATIGHEKQHNPYLQQQSFDTFVERYKKL